jgi:hypothetical protein
VEDAVRGRGDFFLNRGFVPIRWDAMEGGMGRENISGITRVCMYLEENQKKRESMKFEVRSS